MDQPSARTANEQDLAQRVQQLSLHTLPPAAAAALGTYELLEHILTFLPPRSIETAKRVCKAWKHIIKSSKRVQKAAVLLPMVPSNKFLRFQRERLPGNASLPRYDAPRATSIRLHPDLAASRDESGAARRFSMTEICKQTSSWFGLPPFHRRETLPVKQIRKFQSAQDCFATHPPCGVIGMQLRESLMPKEWTECVVYVPEGVRIRDLVAVARALLRQTRFVDGEIHQHLHIDGRIAWYP